MRLEILAWQHNYIDVNVCTCGLRQQREREKERGESILQTVMHEKRNTVERRCITSQAKK